MSDKDKADEARELVKRAGRESRHAGRDATKAAKLAGEVAAHETADALVHAATEAEEAAARGLSAVEYRALKAKEKAAEAAETAKRVSPRINTKGLAAISGDTGTGFLALSVALYSGTIAYYKFRAAIQGRSRAVKP